MQDNTWTEVSFIFKTSLMGFKNWNLLNKTISYIESFN